MTDPERERLRRRWHELEARIANLYDLKAVEGLRAIRAATEDDILRKALSYPQDW